LAVRLRARDACEYCLAPTAGLFHVDHVVPAALWPAYRAGRLPGLRPRPGRRGPDHLDNLAWSCPFCNAAKGQRVTGRAGGGRPGRLFDPRRDRWPDHFAFVHRYLFVVGISRIGRITERALGLNDARVGGPLGTRHDAILVGRYPPSWATRWLVTTAP
jgi:hypothetical protein